MISLIQLLKEVQDSPKAIILAGAPGSGKGTILKDLNLSKFKILNIDDTIAALSKQDQFTLDQKTADSENRSKFMSAMQTATKQLKNQDLPQTILNKESFILDGTASSSNQTLKLKSQLEEAGYEVMMLYVYTELETSLKRNEERFEKSGGEDRSLLPGAVLGTWLMVAKNFPLYQQLFGNNFVSVSNTGNNETLKDIDQIIQKYVTPFDPKDPKQKTEKEQEKSNKLKEKVKITVIVVPLETPVSAGIFLKDTIPTLPFVKYEYMSLHFLHLTQESHYQHLSHK
jgi:adenylate kinase family enzyme